MTNPLVTLLSSAFLFCPLFCIADDAQLAEKPFVVVIPAHNDSNWYQQNLDSVFNQKYENYRIIYIADAPTDNTDRLVAEYIAQNNQEKRVTLLTNKERRGLLACMCQAIFSCSKEEIVVDLEGRDFLAHDDVLSHLNATYADPDVWMTYGQFKYYPSFSQGFASPIPSDIIEANSFRSLKGHVTHPRTFYAALFQEIEKKDFLSDGSFYSKAGDLSYLIPMLEMAGAHSRFIPDVLYIFNYSFPSNLDRQSSDLEVEMDQKIRRKTPYAPLPELPLIATSLPASIYRQIQDITHPTLGDYRFIQNYLRNGKRDNLDRLGNMQEGLKAMKLIGPSSEEVPMTGSVHLNCSVADRENCILLYSTFNRNYPNGLKRLLQRIIDSDYKGHVLYRLGGWPDEDGGSLVLSHVPYAFKPSFFKQAQRMGFKRILWLDTSVVPLVSLNQIFAMIEEKGYFVMGNSHKIGPFMNAEAAAYFGLTLSQTQEIPSCSAGLFGLDLTHPSSQLLLDMWYKAAFDKDAFFSLRSDQNALSILLYQMNMTDFTDLSRMPHAEIDEPIKPDSLFYLDRLFVQ